MAHQLCNFPSVPKQRIWFSQGHSHSSAWDYLGFAGLFCNTQMIQFSMRLGREGGGFIFCSSQIRLKEFILPVASPAWQRKPHSASPAGTVPSMRPPWGPTALSPDGVVLLQEGTLSCSWGKTWALLAAWSTYLHRGHPGTWLEEC